MPNIKKRAKKIAAARMVTVLARIADESNESKIKKMALSALESWFAAKKITK